MNRLVKAKRLIALNLAVLMLLAAMVPMGAMATPAGERTASVGEVIVTANNPAWGWGWASEDIAGAGEQVWLRATPLSGAMLFVRWEVVSGGVTVVNPTSRWDAYFIMPTPAVDVELRAVFAQNPDAREVTVSVSDPAWAEVWASHQVAEPGALVSLEAWAFYGVATFVRWEVVSGNVTIVNPTSHWDAYFIMPTPAVDVELRAVFERDPNVGVVRIYRNHPLFEEEDFFDFWSGAAGGTVPLVIDGGLWRTDEYSNWIPLEFVRWEVVSGGVTIADPNSERTHFTMPNPVVDVQVRAVLQDGPVFSEMTFPIEIEDRRTFYVDEAGVFTFRAKGDYPYLSTASLHISDRQGNRIQPIAELNNGAAFTEDLRFNLPEGWHTFCVDGAASYASLRLWRWDDNDTPPTENIWGVSVGRSNEIDDIEWTGHATSSAYRPAPGEQVTLTAHPRNGFEFVRWNVVSGIDLGANATNPNPTFTMPNNDVFVNPIFRMRDDAVRVTVRANDTALGWTWPNPGWTVIALAGDIINLSAEPLSGWEWCDEYGETTFPLAEFVRWEVLSGNARIADPTSPDTYFTMLAPAVDVEIQAVFRLADGIDAGRVTVMENNPDLGWTWPRFDEPRIVLAGNTVSLEAGARAGAEFVRWDVLSGNVTIAEPTLEWTYFTMPTPATDVVIEAVFVRVGETPPPPRVLVTGVSITGAATRSLTVGQAVPLTAAVVPANATNQNVTWTTNNPAVATVSSTGQVTAVSAGTAVITVTTADGNRTATVTVTVTAPTTPPPVTPPPVTPPPVTPPPVTPPPVNRAPIQTLVTQGLAREGADYTNATWRAFAQALEAAQAATASQTATQAEIDAAYTALRAATAELATIASFENPFEDVAENNWFFENVMYAYANRLMTGTTGTRFAPNATLSRGMVVTVLYRMEGEPEVDFEPIFNDVAEGRWYSDAVIWAYQNEIVQGISANRFAPGNDITREQLATMLYRYARFMEYDLTVPNAAGLGTFADYGEVNTWAEDAMRWAVYHELVRGSNNNLMPRGDATRAQYATILQRLIDRFEFDR